MLLSVKPKVEANGIEQIPIAKIDWQHENLYISKRRRLLILEHEWLENESWNIDYLSFDIN